jgi:acetyl esterase/lipase
MKPFKRTPIFMWSLVALALVLLVFLVLRFGFSRSGALMPAFDDIKLGTVDHDVTYCTINAEDLGMDIHYPVSPGPWPVLLFVHGGGWSEGDKADVDASPTAAGFLVASINYRMYPDQRFPAMIEDVKCAIRFLRAHASQYNLDPQRIGLIGHSAGGHLVALAGLADASAGWDVGQYLEESSRVQAVVDIAGPSDLSRAFPDWVNELLQGVFGPGQLVSASPVTYASPDDPPFLIIHGDADPLVPVEQAYLLQEALLDANVPVELLIVQNGGHGLEAVGAATIPAGEEVYQQILLFLTQELQKP